MPLEGEANLQVSKLMMASRYLVKKVTTLKDKLRPNIYLFFFFLEPLSSTAGFKESLSPFFYK